MHQAHQPRTVANMLHTLRSCIQLQGSDWTPAQAAKALQLAYDMCALSAQVRSVNQQCATCVTLNLICVVLWQLLLLSTRMRPIKQPMQNMQCIMLSGVLRLDKGRQCHHVSSVTSIRSWCCLIPASVAACHHL